MVTRRRLAGEYFYPRCPRAVRTGLDRLVQRHGLDKIEQLALVFVDALDVHVEQSIRIDLEPDTSLDFGSKSDLVGMLGRREPVPKAAVVRQRRNRSDVFQIPHPFAANRFSQQRPQGRIAFVKPAARRDSVGLVDDPVRMQGVKVAKHRLLHQLGM